MNVKSGVLRGVRVVDLSTIIFGPYCTQMLADMGADVIKVEAPEGDFFRQSGKFRHSSDMGAIHMTMNRGKRSIVLDLKSDTGKQALIDLICTADIFVHNIRGKAIKKLGFDYETLAKLAPGLIYVHCVGYASIGPYADFPAYDDTIQAASGLIDVCARASENGRPAYVSTAIADKVSSLFAVQGVLGAYVHKLRTGAGQHVEVPMFESFVHFLLEEHLFERIYEPPIGEVGYRRVLDKDRKPYPTADGYIAIVAYTDRNWKDLFDLLECPEILPAQPIEGSLLRSQHLGRFYAAIAERTPSRTTAAWMKLLNEINVPAMPVRKIEDILEDPQLKASGFFQVVEHPTEGSYIQMQPPIRYSAIGSPSVGHAPRLGQHTEEVLGELSSGARAGQSNAIVERH